MSELRALPVPVSMEEVANTAGATTRRGTSPVIPEAWPEHVAEAYYH